MSDFSSAIRLADLNDYLERGSSCTNPKFQSKPGNPSESTDSSSNSNPNPVPAASKSKIALSLDSDFSTNRLNADRLNESKSNIPSNNPIDSHFNQLHETSTGAARVTLNDCLACSGCVTTAETVLIAEQSTNEFLSKLSHNRSLPIESRQLFVVSISPASIASISNYFNLNPLETLKRLQTFLHSIEIPFLLETSSWIELSLLEQFHELIQRIQSNSIHLPLLTSECPGWICYAEKTQSHSIPWISNVKSPQQILGKWIKEYFTLETIDSIKNQWIQRGIPMDFMNFPLNSHWNPSKIYHCSIQPCFDKKLEGSRPEFQFSTEEFTSKDVDLVLSTAEFCEILENPPESLGITMKSPNYSFSSLLETPLNPRLISMNSNETRLIRCLDSLGSGGYCENLYSFVSHYFNGISIEKPLEYTWKPGKNVDTKELILERVDSNGIPLKPLKFLIAYGFRNLQSLVKRLKSGKSQEYSFVEVMACPSGCMNGGGQIRLDKKDLKSQREMTQKMMNSLKENSSWEIHEFYSKGVDYNGMRGVLPQPSEFTSRLYRDWIGGAPGSSEAKKKLYTEYQIIEPTEKNPMTIKW